VALAAGTNEAVGDWSLHLQPGPSEDPSSSSSSSAAAAARTHYMALQLTDERYVAELRDAMRNALIAGSRVARWVGGVFVLIGCAGG